MAETDITKLDLYELFGIPPDATTKDIKKAYRRKALECHPDKNPDNAAAVRLFQRLSKAFEVLSDETAKAAYDKVLRGRKAAQIRNRELDAKRRRLKEDLERREKAAADKEEQKKSEEQKLNAEIERLRREGSEHLRQEQEEMRRELENMLGKLQYDTEETEKQLKARWKAEKGDTQNGGYSMEILKEIFSKYGYVTCIVSRSKNGSALIEFESHQKAKIAQDAERGLLENPLRLEWLHKRKPQAVQLQKQSYSPPLVNSDVITERDYEDLVLHNMRRAEERKRLIENMEKEEEEGHV